MRNSHLTIGDVLPATLKNHYSAAVLNVTIKEALDIAKFDEPPTSNLSDAAIKSINEIYSHYLSTHAHDTESAYWNKTDDENEAFWNKN
ncbi:MAG: hypothetical protein V4683_15055 [Bacteroidota bacterium]